VVLQAGYRELNAGWPCPKSGVAGEDKLNTGSAGALARRSVLSTLNLNLLDAVTFSRFALIAGEGARVPSTNRLVPDWIDFLGKATRV